jgi:hypothetical protein
MDFERFVKYVELHDLASRPWRPPVGAGWHPMLHDALTKIDAIVGGDASRFRVDQIKEKFGALRFYVRVVDDLREPVFTIKDEIERRSARTCEVCGADAQIESYGGWYGCLCPTHAIEMLDERKIKIGSTGWRLGRIGRRVALIDKVTGEELGELKFAEIEARVAANMLALRAAAEAPQLGRKSPVGSEARKEVVLWRHAKFVANRHRLSGRDRQPDGQ